MLKENNYSVAKPVMAFAGAGLVMTLSNPFDFVRIRMQTMSQLVQMGKLQKSYEGIVDCARRVTKQEGIRAFWKGNATNLIRFYASQSINFISKQAIRTKLKTVVPHNQIYPIFLNVLSGVLGSWLALSFLYPIEHTRNRLSNNTTCKSNGIINTLIKTTKTQGFTALYTGCTISMIGVAIFRGSYFGIFDTYKKNKNNLQKWALAYFSSMVAILLTYPSDTVRRRLICAQTRKLKYKGFWDCLRRIYQKQGLSSFYRGGPIIFLQSVASSSILFLYDKLHNDLKKLSNY